MLVAAVATARKVRSVDSKIANTSAEAMKVVAVEIQTNLLKNLRRGPRFGDKAAKLVV